MQKKLLSLFLSLAIVQYGSAQISVKGWFNPSDTVYGYYSVQEPLSKSIKGAIVLLDGYGGNALSLYPETTIDELAYRDSLLLITLPTGRRIYPDAAIIDLLNLALSNLTKKYNIPKNKFVIGGFSSGGTIALRYSQLCIENPANYPIIPSAVFVIDAPVDLLGLYKRAKSESATASTDAWAEESKMIVDVLEKELGDPTMQKEKWDKANPFTALSTSAGSEKFISTIPFRTYHEVDINWYLLNRKKSIYSLNMLDASDLVRKLQTLGNSKAEFIQSTITGKRSNGQRHPHSWNIVDAADLLLWVKEAIE